MRFVVGTVFTQAYGSSLEMTELTSALTVPEPGADFSPWAPQDRCFLDDRGCFYSGLHKIARKSLRDLGLDVDVEYLPGVKSAQQILDINPEVVPGKTLRDYQIRGAQKSIYQERGIIRIGTGSGKSILALAIIRTLNLPTLFVVHSQNLLIQTAQKFVDAALGDDLVVLGDVQDESRDALESTGVLFWDPEDPEAALQRPMCVAMVHSLYSMIARRDPAAEELLTRTEVLIGDEVHHLASRIWGVVFSQCPARYRYGLSATPWVKMEFERNARDYQVMGLTGPVVYELPNTVLEEKKAIEKPRVFMIPLRSQTVLRSRDWQEIHQKGIVDNDDRNAQILAYARLLHQQGEKTIIPVSRHEHLALLLRGLDQMKVPAYGSVGGRKVLEWSGGAVVEASLTPEALHCAVAASTQGTTIVCTSVYDEALDLPELTAIILAAGGKSVRQVLQRIGRVLRPSSSGGVVVIDFFDHISAILRNHSYQRRKIYDEMQWPVEVAIPRLDALRRVFSQ